MSESLGPLGFADIHGSSQNIKAVNLTATCGGHFILRP